MYQQRGKEQKHCWCLTCRRVSRLWKCLPGLDFSWEIHAVPLLWAFRISPLAFTLVSPFPHCGVPLHGGLIVGLQGPQGLGLVAVGPEQLWGGGHWDSLW